MTTSIGSSTHASSALPAAQGAPQAKTASPLPQKAKSTSLPQDTVKLSRQTPPSPAAKSIHINQNGDNH
jgi:hypothetical protein